MHMRRGAGAYICGEESSLLESIEGKRGLPRHKPPYPFQVGLFGLPTLINNVETLFWVRDIVEKGADWWKSHGRNDRHGLRSYSVSGRVKNPGVKLAPAGVTVRELIDEFCGGMADGHTFHAYLPGGASGGILPASMDDIPLDFGTLEKYGCFIGSAAVVVLSEQDDVKGAALNLMRFFEDESCGQCTPCRVGTQKAAILMERPVWNRELLDELSQAMRDASICGLGQAASNPLTIRHQIFSGRIRAERGRGMTTRSSSNSTASRSRPTPARRSGRSPKRQGRDIPHLCYSPEPDYRPDGNCRACMVEIEGERVLAASCKRTPSVGMKVKIGERARGRGAEDGDGAAGRRSAGARDLARSRFEILALGRQGRGHRKPLPRRRALAWRRQPSGDARQSRRLHPVRPVRARLPRGPGQRRDRHGLSQP